MNMAIKDGVLSLKNYQNMLMGSLGLVNNADKGYYMLI